MTSRILKEENSEQTCTEPQFGLFSKEKLRLIEKNFSKYVKNAIEYKDYSSVIALFNEHPLYRNLETKWNPDSVVTSFEIYSQKRGDWKKHHTVTFNPKETEKGAKIYETIGKAIEDCFNQENVFAFDPNHEDIFPFE